MKSLKLLVVVALFIAANISAFSQNDDPAMEIGFKPYGSYHGGDLDSINLSNGFLNLHIPVVNYPQRGDISYTVELLYNNTKGWSVFSNCSNQNTCNPVWQWKGSGVTLSTQSQDFFVAGPGPYVKNSTIIVYTAVTSDFATHQMAITPAGSAESIDGSGIWQNGSAFGTPGFSRSRRGMQNNSTLEDANGNIFGTAANGGSSNCPPYGCGVVYQMTTNADGTWASFSIQSRSRC